MDRGLLAAMGAINAIQASALAADLHETAQTPRVYSPGGSLLDDAPFALGNL